MENLTRNLGRGLIPLALAGALTLFSQGSTSADEERINSSRSLIDNVYTLSVRKNDSNGTGISYTDINEDGEVDYVEQTKRIGAWRVTTNVCERGKQNTGNCDFQRFQKEFETYKSIIYENEEGNTGDGPGDGGFSERVVVN